MAQGMVELNIKFGTASLLKVVKQIHLDVPKPHPREMR